MPLPSGYSVHRAGRAGWVYLCVPMSPEERRDFDVWSGGRWITSEGFGCMRVYCRVEHGPELLRDLRAFAAARAIA